MYKWYDTYKGSINNLAIVKNHNIIITSVKGIYIY